MRTCEALDKGRLLNLALQCVSTVPSSPASGQPCLTDGRRYPRCCIKVIDLRPKGNLLGQEAFPHLPQSPGYNNGSSTTSPHSQRHLIIIPFSSSYKRCIHKTHSLFSLTIFHLSLALSRQGENTIYDLHVILEHTTSTSECNRQFCHHEQRNCLLHC